MSGVDVGEPDPLVELLVAFRRMLPLVLELLQALQPWEWQTPAARRLCVELTLELGKLSDRAVELGGSGAGGEAAPGG